MCSGFLSLWGTPLAAFLRNSPNPTNRHLFDSQLKRPETEEDNNYIRRHGTTSGGHSADAIGEPGRTLGLEWHRLVVGL